MKKRFAYLFGIVAVLLLLMNSCQKEFSFENGNTPSAGSLQDDGTGNCLPETVNGAYIAGTALVTDTNTISVTVNVTQTGAYTIYSDTINGFHFYATGVFTAVGTTSVTLKGSGTPLTSGINNFLVTYDSTACSIPVTVLPVGTGPADFTLAGSPGNCSGAVVNGGYSTGVALNSANTVTISVDVTTIGTYNISTTFQGMTFSGTGAFATTGSQTVTLNGSGTPTTSGVNNVPITAGSTSCSFQVDVTSPAVGTISCGSEAIGGVYVVSTAMVATDTVQLQVNVTSAGSYNISTDLVNGFGFLASGTFTTTGIQTVTLVGSGTPTLSGSTTFTVTFGSSTCTFSVTVDPSGTSSDLNWQFTQGSTNYGGPTTGAVEASFGGMNSISIEGTSTSPSTDYDFVLQLSKSGSMSTGTFSSSSMTNTVLFTVINLTASQTTFSSSVGDGSNLTVNLTTYDPVGKIVQGNFSGTAKNTSGTIVNIMSGTFKAQIQ